MDVFVAKYAGTDGATCGPSASATPPISTAPPWPPTTSGNVVLTGDFIGSIDFGGGALPSTTGPQTIFLAKLCAPTAAYQWARSFVAAGLNVGSYGWAVAHRRGEQHRHDRPDVRPGRPRRRPAEQRRRRLRRQVQPHGRALWSKNFRGGGGQGRGIAVDADDDIVITGAFDTVQDFGGGDLRSAGNTGTDAFAHLYRAAEPPQLTPSTRRRDLERGPPASHTTVRTVPYTAVHEAHASLRCSSRKLKSPILRSMRVGTAWCMWLAPAFHHGPRPL